MDCNKKEVFTVGNSSIDGKEYSFVSSRYMTWRNWLTRVFCKAKFTDDRLLIEIKPQKYNKAPVIYYEDITSIQVTSKIATTSFIYVASCVVVGITVPVTFLLIPVFLWGGSNKKITIFQRGGVSVAFYERSKAKTQEFVEDIKRIAKIQ